MSYTGYQTQAFFLKFTAAPGGLVTSKVELQAAANSYITGMMVSDPDLNKITFTFTIAVHVANMEVYVYFTNLNGLLNLGYWNTTTHSCYKNVLHACLLNPSLVSDTTTAHYNTALTPQVVVSTTYLYAPFILNSKTFTSVVDMKAQLEALGFITAEVVRDPRIITPGVITTINYDYYDKMTTASQVVNAVVLQQDPNQIILNDQTGLVMANYRNLYLMSYFFKTGHIPKLVT